ncbi:hypothetical protein IFM58399_01356 [Aspergillus lentulus]|uniref:uncharacterized protein n=1 Tax=Aspergillus lentulus TaxID=293939 RepID=UPI00139472AD|nr:uncharacterized protein IFM58399_01356 [Aspergillus lentulus]GFF26245.1 hypothetical protein IFM58399_01356 [Aspergillus lentulus]GFG17111.1 hypothetical protein IFM61392_09864 [Aspergillus lentulus]
MFLDLDMERMNKVFLPGIKGSTYLEEIFRHIELEFFVFFLSMDAEGLNASAVHIGAIFGNGYVTREPTLAQPEFLPKVGNLWLSEHDFCWLFAKALYARQHQWGCRHELSTGLKIIDNDESQVITWFNNPMFQHCIKKTGRTELVAEGSTSWAPVKVRLLEAVSLADVHDIILVEDDRPIAGLTADTLGIDSLVALDIRSWFIKELHVEIRVLKILSGATVDEILVQAQELLPKELTPKLDPNASSKPSKPKQTVQQPQHSNKSGMAQNDFSNSASVASQQLPVAEDNASTLGHSTHGRHEIDLPAATPSPDATKSVSSVSVENVSENSDSSLQESATIDLSTDSKHRPDQDVLVSSMSSSSWSEIDESEGKTELSSSKSSITTSHIIPMTIAVEPKKSVPISFAQSRFWFLRHYLEDPPTFNITVSIRLDGPLRVDDFARAFKSLDSPSGFAYAVCHR